MEIHWRTLGMLKPWNSMKKPWKSSGSPLEHFMELLVEFHTKLHGELLLESRPSGPLNRSKTKTNTTFRCGKRTKTPSALVHHVAILHEFSMGNSTAFVPLMVLAAWSVCTSTQYTRSGRNRQYKFFFVNLFRHLHVSLHQLSALSCLPGTCIYE